MRFIRYRRYKLGYQLAMRQESFTELFRYFKACVLERMLESGQVFAWPSIIQMQAKYIRETGLSPFLDDDDGQEAEKFLREYARKTNSH